MSNQPVYRYPPRSHAYNCPCPRCAQFRSRPLRSGAWIWPLLAVLGAVSWAAGAVAAHLLQTAAAGAGIVILALVTWAVVFLNRRAARPPEGRLRVEVLPDPPPVKPASPGPLPRHRDGFEADRAAMQELGRRRRCLHLNAVKVNSALDPAMVYHCWCPDCDPDCKHPLPAAFRLRCCGAEPGTRHQYNCPHRKEQPS